MNLKIEEATIGTRVRALERFPGVPIGAEGVIDEDYGSGVGVAWDLPSRPLPENWQYVPDPENPLSWATGGPIRDGFDKESELCLLEVVRSRSNGGGADNSSPPTHVPLPREILNRRDLTAATKFGIWQRIQHDAPQGLTQAMAAERLGVSPSTVSAILRGDSVNPETLKVFADATGIWQWDFADEYMERLAASVEAETFPWRGGP